MFFTFKFSTKKLIRNALNGYIRRSLICSIGLHKYKTQKRKTVCVFSECKYNELKPLIFYET